MGSTYPPIYKWQYPVNHPKKTFFPDVPRTKIDQVSIPVHKCHVVEDMHGFKRPVNPHYEGCSMSCVYQHFEKINWMWFILVALIESTRGVNWLVPLAKH